MRASRSCSRALGALVIIMMMTAAGTAWAAGGMQARVMVLPSEGKGADARITGEVADALMRGARRATPNVARANATLADTAVIVGCDPAERACLDAVAAALNVDQMLLVKLEARGDVTIIEVTAVSRESQPVSRTFQIRAATRKQDLATMEAAIPALLDAEAKGGTGGGDGTGGDGTGGDGTGGDGTGGDGTGSDGTGGDGTGGDGTGGDGLGGLGGGNGGGGGGPGPGPGEPDDRSLFARRGPQMLVVGGGAVLATGLVFWGLAAAKQGEIDDAPTTTAADLDRLADLEDRGQRFATVGNVLVIAGGVAAGAGAVLWWRSRRATTITPVVTPGRTALVIEVQW